ncbi:MAG: fatty acyl-AMP ligase, partial [Acidobacteriota bacterium]
MGIKATTITDLLEQRVELQPRRLAYSFLVDGEDKSQTLTYLELQQKAKAIATMLQEFKVEGGQALLLFPPGLDYITAFFGCLYAGVIAVPVYPPDPGRLDRTLPRLLAIASDAQPKVVLTTAAILSMAEYMFSEDANFQTVRWLATDNIKDELAADWREITIGNDSIAFLQYTSGSTATPRGVKITHGNLLNNLAAIYQCFELSDDSKGVIWLPLYHDMGLIGGILQPLYGGLSVTLLSPLAFLQKPLRWLQAISNTKADISGGPNFAYDLCVRKVTAQEREALDLSCWQLAFNGAEPVRIETMERFANTFEPCGFRKEAFYPCYGLAEGTLIVSGGKKFSLPTICTVRKSLLEENRVVITESAGEDGQALVSCGKAIKDEKIVIVDTKTLTLCSSEQVGEIWISGPCVAQGYWNQAEQSANVFQAYLADTKEGPFLRTGDLGFLQNEELFVVGRLKDLIIIRGRNFYPQDIELSVEKSHKALRRGCCAVFSVEIDSEERLVVMAEVERDYAKLATNNEEIIKAVRGAIAKVHELSVYAVVLLKAGNIYKTSSGKIQRHACREAFLSGNADVLTQSIIREDIYPSIEISREILLTLTTNERQAQIELYLQYQVARLLQTSVSEIALNQP